MPVPLPLRWQSHRLDVCAVLDDRTIRWVVRDLLEATEGDPGDYGNEPGHHPLVLSSHITATTWSYEQAAELLDSTDISQELLRWMVERENALAALGYGNVHRIATSPAIYDGTLYPVRAAAEILDADPGISTGQGRLFDWLVVRGWAIRRGTEYAPARSALDAGWLAVVPRKLPHNGDPYPQLVITLAGLTELHAVLGGTHPLAIEQEHLK